MSTVSPDSVAQDQIRAFVERILRLKEEVKATQGDIREVYAEAKGNGFDKTTLGKLVNYVEKRASDANALAEQDALFDLYLDAYDSASGPHAHAPARAHVEIIDEFRAGKSGKKEPQAAMPAQTVPAAMLVPKASAEQAAVESSATYSPERASEEVGGFPVAAAPQNSGATGGDEGDQTSQPENVVGATDATAGETATHSLSSAAPLRQTEDRSVEAALHGSAPVTHSNPVTAPLLPAVTVVAGREGATDPSALPAVRLDHSKPHPDCQDPADCGLASWTHMCGGCMRARAATAAGAALQ